MPALLTVQKASHHSCKQAALLSLLQQSVLSSSRLLQFLGAFLEGGQMVLVTEYMVGGDLYNVIGHDLDRTFSWYRRHGLPTPRSATGACFAASHSCDK